MGINMKKVFMFLCFLVMTGCGQRTDGDGIAESLHEYAIEENGGNDGAAKDIPEHVSDTIVGEAGYEYKIDADVRADGYGNAAVYEMTVPQATDAFVKEYADKLFDDSQYKVVKPYEYMSLDELQEEYAFLKLLIEERKDEEYIPGQLFFDADEVASYIQNYTGEHVIELSEGQLLYEYITTNEEAGKGETQVNEITRLRGKVDGEWWEMKFCNGDLGHLHMVMRNMFMPNNFTPLNMDEMSEVFYGANRSDKEKCEKAAADFLSRFGITDRCLAHTGHMKLSEESDYLDGYRFAYTRDMEVPVGFSTMNMACTKNPYETLNGNFDYSGQFPLQGAVQDYIWIGVFEGRVGCMEIDTVYEMGKKMSEDTALLNFEQVYEIAKQTIKKEIDDYKLVTDSEKAGINEICFRYLVISTENGQNYMVPVWMFYEDLDVGYLDDRLVRFAVNAIDGSIVYLLSNGGAGYFVAF